MAAEIRQAQEAGAPPGPEAGIEPAQEARDIPSQERVVSKEVLVPAGLEAVWAAWTTEAGARTFFAPDCRIDLRPGGAYELYFMPEAAPGLKGGDGMLVLAMQAPTMISFTWNAPPSLPEVRAHRTTVVVRLAEVPGGTRVRLHHSGWGEGSAWDQAFAYFDHAWGRIVLPRLVQRFQTGPVDWSG